MNLHHEAVSADLKLVLSRLMQFEGLSSFRLVGGTALALCTVTGNLLILLFLPGGTLTRLNLIVTLRHIFPVIW